MLDAISSSELENDLDGFGGKVSSVTTDNEGLALWSTGHGGQSSLNEVFGVVLLLEDLDSLSETRGTGLLARVGFGRDGLNVGPGGQLSSGIGGTLNDQADALPDSSQTRCQTAAWYRR